MYACMCVYVFVCTVHVCVHYCHRASSFCAVWTRAARSCSAAPRPCAQHSTAHAYSQSQALSSQSIEANTRRDVLRKRSAPEAYIRSGVRSTRGSSDRSSRGGVVNMSTVYPYSRVQSTVEQSRAVTVQVCAHLRRLPRSSASRIFCRRRRSRGGRRRCASSPRSSSSFRARSLLHPFISNFAFRFVRLSFFIHSISHSLTQHTDTQHHIGEAVHLMASISSRDALSSRAV